VLTRRAIAQAALLPAISAVTAGCRSRGARVVGVVPKGANHIFWQSVHAGAVKAGREFGLEIDWNAPAIETDSHRQIEILESMINRRVAGICVSPIDKQALVGVVERAARESIPVSIFDSAIDTDRILSYIATDNVEAGRMAARRMGEILGGKGKVAILGFVPGSSSTMERDAGFEQEIAAKFPAIHVAALQYGMADRAKAMAITENLLTAHPDLKGIFADNETSTGGAAQAIKSRRASGVSLVGFDPSDQIVADVKDGVIDSIVVQDPFRMGYESIRIVALRLKGHAFPKRQDSPAVLVRRQDLAQPAIRALLSPDLDQYLK
jgi:ribose transport system substrate-binding protein